jgi:hypothetical protein
VADRMEIVASWKLSERGDAGKRARNLASSSCHRESHRLMRYLFTRSEVLSIRPCNPHKRTAVSYCRF